MQEWTKNSLRMGQECASKIFAQRLIKCLLISGYIYFLEAFLNVKRNLGLICQIVLLSSLDVGFAIGGDSGIDYLVLQVHYASVDKFQSKNIIQ